MATRQDVNHEPLLREGHEREKFKKLEQRLLDGTLCNSTVDETTVTPAAPSKAHSSLLEAAQTFLEDHGEATHRRGPLSQDEQDFVSLFTDVTARAVSYRSLFENVDSLVRRKMDDLKQKRVMRGVADGEEHFSFAEYQRYIRQHGHIEDDPEVIGEGNLLPILAILEGEGEGLGFVDNRKKRLRRIGNLVVEEDVSDDELGDETYSTLRNRSRGMQTELPSDASLSSENARLNDEVRTLVKVLEEKNRRLALLDNFRDTAMRRLADLQQTILELHQTKESALLRLATMLADANLQNERLANNIDTLLTTGSTNNNSKLQIAKGFASQVSKLKRSLEKLMGTKEALERTVMHCEEDIATLQIASDKRLAAMKASQIDGRVMTVIGDIQKIAIEQSDQSSEERSNVVSICETVLPPELQGITIKHADEAFSAMDAITCSSLRTAIKIVSSFDTCVVADNLEELETVIPDARQVIGRLAGDVVRAAGEHITELYARNQRALDDLRSKYEAEMQTQNQEHAEFVATHGDKQTDTTSTQTESSLTKQTDAAKQSAADRVSPSPDRRRGTVRRVSTQSTEMHVGSSASQPQPKPILPPPKLAPFKFPATVRYQNPDDVLQLVFGYLCETVIESCMVAGHLNIPVPSRIETLRSLMLVIKQLQSHVQGDGTTKAQRNRKSEAVGADAEFERWWDATTSSVLTKSSTGSAEAKKLLRGLANGCDWSEYQAVLAALNSDLPPTSDEAPTNPLLQRPRKSDAPASKKRHSSKGARGSSRQSRQSVKSSENSKQELDSTELVAPEGTKKRAVNATVAPKRRSTQLLHHDEGSAQQLGPFTPASGPSACISPQSSVIAAVSLAQQKDVAAVSQQVNACVEPKSELGAADGVLTKSEVDAGAQMKQDTKVHEPQGGSVASGPSIASIPPAIPSGTPQKPEVDVGAQMKQDAKVHKPQRGGNSASGKQTCTEVQPSSVSIPPAIPAIAEAGAAAPSELLEDRSTSDGAVAPPHSNSVSLDDLPALASTQQGHAISGALEAVASVGDDLSALEAEKNTRGSLDGLICAEVHEGQPRGDSTERNVEMPPKETSTQGLEKMEQRDSVPAKERISMSSSNNAHGSRNGSLSMSRRTSPPWLPSFEFPPNRRDQSLFRSATLDVVLAASLHEHVAELIRRISEAAQVDVDELRALAPPAQRDEPALNQAMREDVAVLSALCTPATSAVARGAAQATEGPAENQLAKAENGDRPVAQSAEAAKEAEEKRKSFAQNALQRVGTTILKKVSTTDVAVTCHLLTDSKLSVPGDLEAIDEAIVRDMKILSLQRVLRAQRAEQKAQQRRAEELTMDDTFSRTEPTHLARIAREARDALPPSTAVGEPRSPSPDVRRLDCHHSSPRRTANLVLPPLFDGTSRTPQPKSTAPFQMITGRRIKQLYT